MHILMISRYDIFLAQSCEMQLNAGQKRTNNEWHFVCLTRESSSGETKFFWFGKKSVSANKFCYPGQTMKKGGKAGIAGYARRNLIDLVSFPVTENLPLTVTQVNVWDRLLSQDEIAVMSKREKCDGGAGNVVDWQDFKSGLDFSKFTEIDQSQCTTSSQ